MALLQTSENLNLQYFGEFQVLELTPDSSISSPTPSQHLEFFFDISKLCFRISFWGSTPVQVSSCCSPSSPAMVMRIQSFKKAPWAKGGGGGKGKGGGGKGGKGAGQWVFVPQAQSQGRKKGGGQQQHKQVKQQHKQGGKGGRKQGRQGGKERRNFTDLDPEKQEAIKAKWEQRAEREGREAVGGGTFSGTVVWKCKSYGWILPSAGASLPKKVKEAMASMTEELRAKSAEHDRDQDRFNEDVLYFRMSDRAAMDDKLEADASVKFKVYVDSKGAGAKAVKSA